MKRVKRERIRLLYAKVRPYVERHCGRGSLSERRFAEFCREGDALMRSAERKQKSKDPLAVKLAQLERRIRRLEAQK